MAIWQDLVDDHGFTVRYASVRRFVLTLRGTSSPEARGVITSVQGRNAMAMVRMRRGLTNSDQNPHSSRSVRRRFGARWRPRRKTISGCFEQQILRHHGAHATRTTELRGQDRQVQ
jgi:hypothetical protein